jgi:hypothetical protein
LSNATVRTSSDVREVGKLQVGLTFSQEGAEQFASVVRELGTGQMLAIVLDDVVQSSPVLQDSIVAAAREGWRSLQNSTTISGGNMGANEAKRLAAVLRAGALPVSVRIAEETSIGPSLGSDSIRRGMMAAQGRLRLFTDADLSTPIEELDLLSTPIAQGYHVTFGSRALRESQLLQRQPLYRETMGRIFNIFVRLLHLPGIKDTQCGFKLFTEEAAKAIFERQRLSGFCFDVEVLTLAVRLGFKIKEVPVRWIDSPQSRVNPLKDSIRMLWDLIRLKFRRD